MRLLNLFCLLAVAATSALSSAQDAADKRASLEVSQLPVRAVLSKLFVGKSSFALAPEIRGTITVSVRDVGFETALGYVLKQVDAKFKFADGVYVITPITREPGWIDQLDPDHRIVLQFERTDIQSAIRSLFGSVQPSRKFKIDPKLKGFVSGAHYADTLEEAICWLAEQAGGSVKLQNGKYVISTVKG